MLLWQRMAPPHNGRSITCELCSAGPSLAKDFFSILLEYVGEAAFQVAEEETAEDEDSYGISG